MGWTMSESDVPYSGFHVVFADNRHLVPATSLSNQFEEWRYSNYDPENCINVGSRNTDVLTAKINAEISISAPTTYKSLENDVNTFPFTLRNGTASNRTFRLEIIEGQGWASFSYDIDNGVKTTEPDDDVLVYPFSSISQSVYIKKESDVLGPVKVKATDVDTGDFATVTFNAGFTNVDAYTGTEIDNPFVRNPFVRNPFVKELLEHKRVPKKSVCSEPVRPQSVCSEYLAGRCRSLRHHLGGRTRCRIDDGLNVLPGDQHQ